MIAVMLRCSPKMTLTITGWGVGGGARGAGRMYDFGISVNTQAKRLEHIFLNEITDTLFMFPYITFLPSWLAP